MVAKNQNPPLPEERKSGILRGYCRDEGPKYRYWAVDRTRGRQITQGQTGTSEGRQILDRGRD